MSNPAYGYSNVPEKWAVRISDNGEFIHQNQNTIADQGVDKSATAASTCPQQALKRTSSRRPYADPVQVTGTSVQLSADDRDVYDWAMTRNEWQAIAVRP